MSTPIETFPLTSPTSYAVEKKTIRIRKLHSDFLELVSKKYMTHHQVNEYADMLCVSVKTLQKAVKSAGHTTPLRIIHGKLIEEAERLLMQPNAIVNETAQVLGFEDTSNFSKFFKRHTGKTPSLHFLADAV